MSLLVPAPTSSGGVLAAVYKDEVSKIDSLCVLGSSHSFEIPSKEARLKERAIRIAHIRVVEAPNRGSEVVTEITLAEVVIPERKLARDGFGLSLSIQFNE